MNDLFAITTGILFGLGVFQLLRRDLIKSAMGFYILFTGINLFLISVGVFDGNVPAYVTSGHGDVPVYIDEDGELQREDVIIDGEIEQATPSDPLVQALILTAIVISFGSYALLMGMINVASLRFKTVDSDHVDNLKG
jgi:multicomponent Na+:H+ antiporter subunit C